MPGDLPQQFRNERHDGNFQVQSTSQVLLLLLLLEDSHGLLGGGGCDVVVEDRWENSKF